MPRRPNIRRVSEDAANPQRHSTYMITINTNVRPVDADDQVVVENLFYDALAAAFEEDLYNMLNWRRGYHPEHFTDDPQVNIRVETGDHPRGSRVHSHTLLHIEHTTNIQLDHNKIKSAVMRQILSGPLSSRVAGIYVHFELVRNVQRAWELYQKKKNKVVTQAKAVTASRARRRQGPANTNNVGPGSVRRTTHAGAGV